MVYIPGIAEQFRLFLLSLGFGFLMGILYEVFRIIRNTVRGGKAFSVAADITYFIFLTVLSFFYLIVVDGGKIRLYTVGGEIFGWIIYYFSAGVALAKARAVISAVIRSLFMFIFKPLSAFKAKKHNPEKIRCNFNEKIRKKQEKKKKTSCKNDIH